MINALISALIALFFWTKATKDTEEKTEHASWLRTGVFGVLALVVIAFYLKTNQVATVYQSLAIQEIRGVEKSFNSYNDIDTIESVDILNRFSDDITENILKSQQDLGQINNRGYESLKPGGCRISFHLRQSNECKTQNIKSLEKSFGVQLADSFNHAFIIGNLTNAIPSLLPLFITNKKHTINIDPYLYVKTLDYDLHSYRECYELKDIINLCENTSDGNLCINYIAASTQNGNKKIDFTLANNYINNLGFLSAADISQYTYCLNIKSSYYIKKINVDYDLPIEITPHDTCMTTQSTSFVIKGKYLNNIINRQDNGFYVFHVKLPTLANLQLIRSLILTTLLTALVSLFFISLFYRVRKWAIGFKERHISEINADKVEKFKKKMGLLLWSFLILLVYVSCRIFINKPYYIGKDIGDFLLDYWVFILIGLIVILCAILYLMFRGAYTIKKKDKKK